jgi:excisionase family DNA binding protein
MVEAAKTTESATSNSAIAEVLTPKEAAEFLKMSVRTLHRRTILGEIPCYRSGHIIRYSRQALLNCLLGNV